MCSARAVQLCLMGKGGASEKAIRFLCMWIDKT
jgi:hypothetical protein